MITPGTANVTITLGVSNHSGGRYGPSAEPLLYLEGWIDCDHGGTCESGSGASKQFVQMAIDASNWSGNTQNLDVSFTAPAGSSDLSPRPMGDCAAAMGRDFWAMPVQPSMRRWKISP